MTRVDEDLLSLLRLLACTSNQADLDYIIWDLWPSASSRIKENWSRHDYNYRDLLHTPMGVYCIRCDTHLGVCEGGALRKVCSTCNNSHLYPTNSWRYHILLVVAESPFQPYYCHLLDNHLKRNKTNDHSVVQDSS